VSEITIKTKEDVIMKRKITILVFSLILTMTLSAAVAAEGHGHKQPMKKGILLVAFGSSIPEAQVSFKNIDKRVKNAFPGVPLRWAYTSHIIRHKLAKEGKQLDSMEMALAKMMDEGFTHVAVQSLHTIAGEEYHGLVQNAHAFGQMSGGFECILVGYPLLGKEDDLVKVTELIIKNIPKDRKKEDAVVLMGHGTHHPGNAFYAAMMYHFQQKDPNIFVGTVEGSPTIDDIKGLLLKKKIKKAYLMPFMSVAGDHARNDMAGDEDDSWKSILTKAGIKCVPVLKGTAEYNDIVDIWVAHLKTVLAHF
jgi:sirohydrochlorin cobaltochelatase